jgi:nicotinamide-nucleotide amidase
MRARIIAVGSEMLGLGRVDANGDWLIEQLGRLGVAVESRCVVEDDPDAIASAVRGALGRVGAVIVSGGLGPTEDDRTRDGLARALGTDLERDPERLHRLEELFRMRGRTCSPRQARQADRPAGAAWIENTGGTAPGLALKHGDTELFALPGVPAEMQVMFRTFVAPRIAARADRVLARRTLRVAGRTELSVDDQLRDLYGAGGLRVTVLAGREGIEVHLLAEGRDQAAATARIEEIDARMSRRLGRDLYGRDDETLATVVGSALECAGRTLATAESCTAGLLAAAVTGVPGSSAWFRGGFVVYSDDLKKSLAGVAPEVLEKHGAVSAEVADELARGARARCGADYGIGITGIAGPGGGSAQKPVGLVHLALAERSGTETWRLLQSGDRNLVRHRTVATALDRLRRRLLDSADEGQP